MYSVNSNKSVLETNQRNGFNWRQVKFENVLLSSSTSPSAFPKLYLTYLLQCYR